MESNRIGFPHTGKPNQIIMKINGIIYNNENIYK